jgi:hypothetical protein
MPGSWYNSPAYKRILSLRVNGTLGDLVRVDGGGPDFTVAGFAREIRPAKTADRMAPEERTNT